MSNSAITFGPLTFDPASGVLRGNGTDLRLGQRAAALLQALIDADQQPVAKSALLDAAWPGMVVEEGNLTVQIAALRKALGLRPDGQEWIVTVPRLGYRLFRGDADAQQIETAPPIIPIIAVLPFVNIGGDPEQDYFGEGFADDIITALSRFKSLIVIARNSSFFYKGLNADARAVARDLGAHYLLQGSVRRGGDRLRVNAQLVAGESGAHLWAERFDGSTESVFDVQDTITEKTVVSVDEKIMRAEIERSRRERPGSLAAYDLYLQALPKTYSSVPELNEAALLLLERSINLDPVFAPALAAAGMTYLMKVAMQFPGSSDADERRAVTYAQAAIALAGDDPSVLGYSGFIFLHMGRDYDTGLALLRRAVTQNPNDAQILNAIGVGNLLGGSLTEAAEYLLRSLRLNPNGIGMHWQLTGMAHIRMAEGRYAEALDWATKSQSVNPVYDANHWMLIAANAWLGNLDEARRYLRALEEIAPGVTLSRVRRGQHSRDPHRIEVLIEGMRMAGMAEE